MFQLHACNFVIHISLFCFQQLDISLLFDLGLDLSPDSEVSSPTEDKGEGLVHSPTSVSMTVSCPTLTCKTGVYKRSPGFQPTVCCMIPAVGSDTVPLSNMAVSSEFGVWVKICSQWNDLRTFMHAWSANDYNRHKAVCKHCRPLIVGKIEFLINDYYKYKECKCLGYLLWTCSLFFNCQECSLHWFISVWVCEFAPYLFMKICFNIWTNRSLYILLSPFQSIRSL